MKVVYVSGPYRSKEGIWGVKKNIDAAERVAVELWQMGLAVICPHKNSAFLDGAAPDKVWLKGDLELIRRCDAVVVVGDWKSSDGTKAEIFYANKNRIPIFVYAKFNTSVLKSLLLKLPQRRPCAKKRQA